ncbi:AI-2E family transporter, partial [Janibacter sp. RAF20_2_2]
MSDKRRPKGVRLPRLPRRLPQLPQLPAPPPQERQIVIQTTPPGAGGSGAVPPAFRAASEWVWRSLVIGVGIIALLWLISKLSEVVFPVIIALLLAALLEPAFQRLRAVLPRGLAAGVTVLGTLAVLIGLFSFVGNQFATQLDDIVSQVSQGVDESRRWAVNTFGLTEGQITTWVSETWSRLTEGDALSSRAAQAGLTVGHLLTGFFLAMFSLFFFLYDGAGIWAWVVRLFPRGARAKVLSSGAIAWNQLKAFTRATILVAGTDALGIGLGAFGLGVPFASGIALLVFIGAFIPIVGALMSGFVAVALAFVAKGPITALI